MNDLHNLRVELYRRVFLEFANRVFMAQGGAVRSSRGHRVVGIGNMHDARAQGNFQAGLLEGIAGAVPILVVQLHNRQVLLESADPFQNSASDRRMLAKHGHFVGGKLAGLSEDAVGNADLADVVKKASDANDLDVVGPQGSCPWRSRRNSR